MNGKHQLNISIFRKLIVIIFLIYILVLISIVFVGFHRNHIDMRIRYNLIPFNTIRNYLFSGNNYYFKDWFNNVFGNILLFSPLGCLLPFIFKKATNFKNIMVISIFVSALIEILQLFTRVGSFDIDDIILNAIGGSIGFLVFNVLSFFMIKVKKRIFISHE